MAVQLAYARANEIDKEKQINKAGKRKEQRNAGTLPSRGKQGQNQRKKNI
jgi:hypothetical protein